MANLLVSESWVDETRGIRLGDSGVYEAFTDDTGKLYRALVKEYGRCKGHVYIDGKDGKPQKIGWVFLQRTKYDDCDKTFLRQTWVTLHEADDTVQRTHHYHFLK